MTHDLDPASVDVLTLRLLEQIRDEMRSMRGEMRTTRDELAARIDQTNARIDQGNARIDTLRDETGTRLQFLEHAMVELTAAFQHRGG